MTRPSMLLASELCVQKIFSTAITLFDYNIKLGMMITILCNVHIFYSVAQNKQYNCYHQH